MRRTCSLGLFLVLGICLGLGFNRSWGQTSRKLMNLQGRLTDTEGSPTNGPHLFELRIFDAGAAGSGTQLYYEAQRVEVNKGIYNVLVGEGYNSFTGNDPDSYAPAGGQTGGIPASVFNRDNLWLEIEIDEDNPLDPRTRVVSSAYAFNADTLDGKDSAAFLEAGGDAALADVQVNTLSFTGGGELSSSGLSLDDGILALSRSFTDAYGTTTIRKWLDFDTLGGLLDGGDTTLHSHPGSGSVTCPSTMVDVGEFCIDKNRRGSTNFLNAIRGCRDSSPSMHLCSLSEWLAGVGLSGYNVDTTNEWVNNQAAREGQFRTMDWQGDSGYDQSGGSEDEPPGTSRNYRCCMYKFAR